MIKYINEAVNYLTEKGFDTPEVGIILGSGLGDFANQIDVIKTVSYNHIPNFPTTTVQFHEGKLIYGILEGKKIIIMQGRFHLYEGYTMQDVTFPVRIMYKLGIKTLLISNASGAINPDLKKGNILFVNDHINLQGQSPLAFKGVEKLGIRFVDMRTPYSKKLQTQFNIIAKNNNINLKQGVYASVLGPQMETPAEYKMLKILGADVVGMSTVPEVIVANHLKLNVAALSIITDECDPNKPEAASFSEIMSIANSAVPKMTLLFREVIKSL